MSTDSGEVNIWNQIGSEIDGGISSNWASRGSSSLSRNGTFLAVGSPDNYIINGGESIFKLNTMQDISSLI